MPNEGDSLSRDARADSAAKPLAAVPLSIVRLRILLVDDDEGCLESVRAALALDGHSIVTASRGLEAVDWARRLREERSRLDLSILDYHMPDLTGLETFERILVELPDVQGIFISGEPSLTLEREVVQAGARALVRKPLDLFRIRTLIREVSVRREIN